MDVKRDVLDLARRSRSWMRKSCNGSTLRARISREIHGRLETDPTRVTEEWLDHLQSLSNGELLRELARSSGPNRPRARVFDDPRAVAYLAARSPRNSRR